MLYDFGGYATKVNLRCSDGRVILKDAFKGNDGQTVPLVWHHKHDKPDNVLGHALLENREDGVYAYCKFNDTPNAKTAKSLVEHGDITSLSIYANGLKEQASRVVHGVIREVSLVMAGANPGALIDNLAIAHSDGDMEIIEDEAVIFTGSEDLAHQIEHADSSEEEGKMDGKTAQEIFDGMSEEEKTLVYAMIGHAISQVEEDDEEEEETDEVEHSDINEGGKTMKKNVFEPETKDESKNTLSHDAMAEIIEEAKRHGSMKQAYNDYAIAHSIVDAETSSKFPEDVLFPDAKYVNNQPDLIARSQEWVTKVWNGTRKSPFSRIKSRAADITADEARARGYIKGKKKIEEVIKMLKRATTPQTVYKLQKMDRDDIIDITDFDVVSWIKAEMRMMLNEELARAILIGDGRVAGDDKISEDHIRPIWTDDDLYTIKYPISYAKDATDDQKARQFIRAVNKARKDYMGSGAPTLYTDTDTLTNMLLAEDNNGRRLYNTVAELASALRVREIVEVPLMEGQKREARSGVSSENGKDYTLLGLIVNLSDYTVGADRGGSVAMFDDFDIDYNKYTYLIETRCSGALTKPYSAIAIELEETAQG